MIHAVEDRDPAAPARLREVRQVLCTRSEDRHRADALLATVVEEHGDR